MDIPKKLQSVCLVGALLLALSKSQSALTEDQGMVHMTT
jgi:hypothetical protein